MTHACKQCGAPIVGKLRESQSRLAARQYCSQACNIASMKKTPPPRNCPVCDKPMHKREGQSYTDFMNQTACSRECGNALVWAKRQNRPPKSPLIIPSKTCLRCGKKMRKRPQGESIGEFERRKFCSHKCSYLHASRESRLRWDGAGDRRLPIRETKPAATEADWLALNGGPTMCPTMYCAPVEHPRHIGLGSSDGRVR